MSVLFNSLPPSIDTLNDFFFAKEKAPKTIYDDPSTLLFRFLQQSPRIRNNIVCSFRSSSSKLTWISYDNWASIYKSAVEAKFIKITNLWRSFFSSKHFDFSELWQSGLLQLNPDSHYFSLEEAQDAFFAFVAHSLWIEIHSILAWSLTQYDDASLKYLLHSKYMFCESSLSSNVFIFGQVFAHDTSYLTPFINLPLRANPIDPMSLYFFLGSRHLINKTGIPENGMAKSMSGSLRGPNPELQLSDFPPKDIISALSHTQRYRIPFKQRYTWKKDALSGLFHSTLSAKRTLSILCRWFAYHMIHGSGYGFWLSGSNLEGPFPPMDRSLSIPIQASRMKTPHQIKLPLEYQALGVKSNDMHLDTGTIKHQ